MKKKQKSLSICIEPEVDKLLEEGGYNKSKLINKLFIYFPPKLSG